MADGRCSAQSKLEMGQRLVAEHLVRVDRQRRFLEDLAVSQHCDNVIQEATESLRQMTSNLNVMVESVRLIAENLSADTVTDS